MDAPRLKVLRIIDRLNIGGPAIHVILLTRGMEGWETRLVAGSIAAGEGDMAYLAERYQVAPLYLPSLQRELSPLKDLRTFFSLLRLIFRERPHIIHTHKSKAGALGRLAGMIYNLVARVMGGPSARPAGRRRGHRARLVHTFHGHVFSGYFGRRKTWVFLAIERWLARRTDRIVVVSPGQHRELSGRFRLAPEEKLSVIPLGFELEAFERVQEHKGALRKELGLEECAPLVATVGRLIPIKDQRLFLEAARAVLEARPDARFLVVGDGELREELEGGTRDLGIEEAVIFTGWLRDLIPLYADVEVVCLSSRNEGTPVSLIEAMAAGLPVVATAVGGVPDVVEDGETGYLVAPGDAAAMAGRMLELLGDGELRARMGAAGRAKALRLYSHRRLLGDIERLYGQLLAS